MKIMMAGVGKIFKTGIRSLPETSPSDIYLNTTAPQSSIFLSLYDMIKTTDGKSTLSFSHA